MRPLFVCFCGDFCSTGVKPQEWQNWLSDWAEDTRSSDRRVYPLAPVRGNHEPKSETLYRLFALDSPDNYFAFNVGGDLFRNYTLNSEINLIRAGDCRETTSDQFLAQTAWLKKDLAEHESTRFKLGAFHKPLRPHTRGKVDNNYLYDVWAKLFYDYHVSLLLEGDSHMHKITYPIRPFKGKGNTLGFIRDDKNGTIYMGEGIWSWNSRKQSRQALDLAKRFIRSV